MVVEWTDKALSAGVDALPSRRLDHDDVAAILDAAVKAQGLYCDSETAFAAGYTDGHKDGCAEAFEEAAKIADEWRVIIGRGEEGHYSENELSDLANSVAPEIAAAIRNLAKEPPK